MKHNLARLFTRLFIIAGLLVIASSLGKAEAQSGLPPLDSNCSDGECVFGVLTSADDAGPTPDYDFSTIWPEIYFGRRPDGSSIVSGLRFANVTLAPNTGIAQAYLVFTVDGTYTTPITIAFYGENSTNAQSFSTSSQPAGRPRLSGLSTVWSVLSSDTWVSGNVRQSPDITAIIQAIADKPGWQSGNALAILVEPTSANPSGNYRRVYAYDRLGGGVTSSVRLVIRTGPRKIFLPLTAKEYPYKKYKSGIHLGSRSGLWEDFTLRRLKGDPALGRYPAVIVTLSSLIYNYDYFNPGCRISAVNPTNPVKDQNLFNYLKDASQHGSLVVIRIWPSPGNFEDAVDTWRTHTIIFSPANATPQNRDYCNNINGKDPRQLFRSLDDVANEIIAIHNYNEGQGWYEWGFEPANEPNNEWYPASSDITIQDIQAWIAMDNYFGNLYIQVHPGNGNPSIRVLTPPMGQFNFAELRNIIDCSFNDLGDFKSGYDWMPSTFKEAAGIGRPLNDGYSWHNYWLNGKETWETQYTDGGACASSGTADPRSNHLVQFFQRWLRDKINTSTSPAFITEADLKSPGPAPCLGGNLSNKDDNDGITASDSLRSFIANEQSADYVAVWNLTIQYADTFACDPNDPNKEFSWHEAYRDARDYSIQPPGVYPTERRWFTRWWTGNE